MTRLTKPARFLTLLLAAIQFAVPAVVSVADGELAKSGQALGSHIEEFGQKQCTPAHSADCAICRFLSTVHNQPSMTAALVVAAEVMTAPVSSVASSSAAERYGFNSRAPPILVD